MEHVAIDLGGRESQICVRDSQGRILEEKRCPTRSLGKYLARRPASRVVMESCAEAFTVAEQAQALGHQAAVVPAMLVRALGVGARKLKNDERDARNLSEASCRMETLPTVHVPSRPSRELKSMCGMREGLLGVRTKLINTVRGWLRSHGLGPLPPGGATSTFSHRCRQHIVKRSAGQSAPPYVDRLLLTLVELEKQIAEADAELEARVAEEPTCQRLMTVPGVGPVVGARFFAAIDDVSRFRGAHAVASYLGLTPGEDSSSERKRTTGITKAGAIKVRWALVQAAWVARRFRRKDPMVIWALGIEERRGKRIAVVALARKLAGILYAIWRDGTTYNPRHQERSVSQPASRG